jgi:hypothetical protein
MPTDAGGGTARYDLNDPKDMAALIATGIIWKGGPTAFEKATEYLRAHPEAVNDKVPASVLALLAPAPDAGAAVPAEPVPGTPAPVDAPDASQGILGGPSAPTA